MEHASRFDDGELRYLVPNKVNDDDVNVRVWPLFIWIVGHVPT